MSDEQTSAPARRQRGLGAGLSSLFTDGQTSTETTPRAPTGQPSVADIDIDLIHRNPSQPRRTFNEGELLSLVDSIKRHGVLQPILLRESPDRPGHYEIIAGERRWRAAQTAGMRSVPAAIKTLDDLAMLEAAVVENLQRVDLNPVDEAAAYQQLIDRFGKTQLQVAEQVGKSRAHIANTVRLLALPADVRAMLVSGALSAGHARALLAVDEPSELAQEVVNKNMSVRELERRINQRIDPGFSSTQRTSTRRKPHDSNGDPDIASLETDLSSSLGLSVRIAQGPGSAGRLEVAYDTLEQLDDLCRRLSSGPRNH